MKKILESLEMAAILFLLFQAFSSATPKLRQRFSFLNNTQNLAHLNNDDEYSIESLNHDPPSKNIENVLNGRSLVVPVISNWPFFGLTKDENGKAIPESGIDVSLLSTLGKVLNFTFTVTSPPDGSWGNPQPDGSITGMIGMVARGEADLAIDEITITGVRETVVDFSHPYFIDSSTIISKAPSRVESVFVIFSPFTFEVWLIIGVTTLIIPTISLILFPWGSNSSSSNRNKPEKENPVKVDDVFFNFFRNLVIQNNRISVNTWPARLIFFAWFLCCYIFYAFYAGTLTAVLAVPTFEKPIDSLTDLLKATKTNGFIPGVLKATSVESLFAEATTGVYKDIYQYFHPNKSYIMSVDEGVDKAQRGQFAYIAGAFALEMKRTLRGKSKFYMAKEGFYMQSYGIVCPQNSPTKSLIDGVLLRILAAGLIDKWSREEVAKVELAQVRSSKMKGEKMSEDTDLKPLSIKQIQGAFVLYLIGLSISILCLLIEKSYFWFQ